MSQAGVLNVGNIPPPPGSVTDLQGNDGIVVGPDGAGIIHLLGGGSITTSGNAGTHTETISLTGLTNHAVLVGAGTDTITKLAIGTNGQVLIGATGADPAFANLTSTGGTIVYTLGANALNLEAVPTGGGVTWSTISASQTLAINHGYICISPGGALSLALPAVSAVGSVIEVTLDGATSYTITQAAGQQIRIGNVATTAGAGGSLASTQQGDTLRMVCSVANLKWNVLSEMGNQTVV